MTPPRAPKYRTDSQACSCPGYWYRRTCRHYRAYAEAVALVLAQDAVNKAFLSIPGNLPCMGVSTIPVNIAAMGVLTIPDNLSPMVEPYQSTIGANMAGMGQSTIGINLRSMGVPP